MTTKECTKSTMSRNVVFLLCVLVSQSSFLGGIILAEDEKQKQDSSQDFRRVFTEEHRWRTDSTYSSWLLVHLHVKPVERTRIQMIPDPDGGWDMKDKKSRAANVQQKA